MTLHLLASALAAVFLLAPHIRDRLRRTVQNVSTGRNYSAFGPSIPPVQVSPKDWRWWPLGFNKGSKAKACLNTTASTIRLQASNSAAVCGVRNETGNHRRWKLGSDTYRECVELAQLLQFRVYFRFSLGGGRKNLVLTNEIIFT